MPLPWWHGSNHDTYVQLAPRRMVLLFSPALSLLIYSIDSIVCALRLLQVAPLRNSDQPSGYIVGFSPPFPATVRDFKLYREKRSAVCSLVDSRRIVRTHAINRRFPSNFFATKCCGHTTTAMHDMTTPTPPRPATALLQTVEMWRLGHLRTSSGFYTDMHRQASDIDTA